MLQEDIDDTNNYMYKVAETLSSMIEDKNYFSQSSDSKLNLKIEYNDRDGHYFSITKRRADILKSKFKKELAIGRDTLTLADLEFKYATNGNNAKIEPKYERNLLNICMKKYHCNDRFGLVLNHVSP
jgi:hypothetical protein